MELEFKKVGSRYEAEFEATDNFNLHIEREAKGDVQIFQKANAECDYATDPSWEEEFASKNIDKDFSMLVFPKYIKIVSKSEVTRCVATISEGGGSIEDNPTDGVSIRPVTADDVVLMLAPESPTVDAENVPFSESVHVPAFNVLFVLSNKQLFFGEKQSHVCGHVNSPHPDYEYTYVFGGYGMSYVGDITLDLYIQN